MVQPPTLEFASRKAKCLHSLLEGTCQKVRSTEMIAHTYGFKYWETLANAYQPNARSRFDDELTDWQVKLRRTSQARQLVIDVEVSIEIAERLITKLRPTGASVRDILHRRRIVRGQAHGDVSCMPRMSGRITRELQNTAVAGIEPTIRGTVTSEEERA